MCTPDCSTHLFSQQSFRSFFSARIRTPSSHSQFQLRHSSLTLCSLPAADSLISEPETTCSKGHLLPFAADPATLRRKEIGQLCRQVESLQGEVRSAQIAISRCNERERQLKHK